MLHSCTIFHETITKGFRVIERKRLHTEITKSHNSANNVGKVTPLVIFTLSDNALYLYQFCESISKGFKVKDTNIMVDARVVTNVDGRTGA